MYETTDGILPDREIISIDGREILWDEIILALERTSGDFPTVYRRDRRKVSQLHRTIETILDYATDWVRGGDEHTPDDINSLYADFKAKQHVILRQSLDKTFDDAARHTPELKKKRDSERRKEGELTDRVMKLGSIQSYDLDSPMASCIVMAELAQAKSAEPGYTANWDEREAMALWCDIAMRKLFADTLTIGEAKRLIHIR